MEDHMSGALDASVPTTPSQPSQDNPSGETSDTPPTAQGHVDEPESGHGSDVNDNSENDKFSTPVQEAVTEEPVSTPATSVAATVGWALNGLGVSHHPPMCDVSHPPLRLLNLPIEVLQVIVRQIGSTNDLTALALTHSVLHAIVIPQLYSRFDIVWPDPSEEEDLSTGVDALAYGLGTLAMSGNILGPKALQTSKCQRCGYVQSTEAQSKRESRLSRRIVDNYAQFTRKFALGNGPLKFVQSYYISTENGKMLGTLVALAIHRMGNLESFIWDMPTGIVREIWEALSSLGLDRRGIEPSSKLESIWIRCPNSYEARTPSQNLHLFLPQENLGARKELLEPSYRSVEHPNFSILPALKSISVLEIDELAYLEELSVLISTSRDRLRKLRIGVSKLSAMFQDRIRGPDSTEPTFLGQSSLTPLGANGVLGMLMSKFCPCYRRKLVVLDTSTALRGAGAAMSSSAALNAADSGVTSQPTAGESNNSTGAASTAILVTSNVDPIASSSNTPNETNPGVGSTEERQESSQGQHLPNASAPKPAQCIHGHAVEESSRSDEAEASEQRRLELEVLAFENVPLSVNVLLLALHWTYLTDLTILNCKLDEDLWKAFTKAITPRSKSHNELSTSTSPPTTPTTPNSPLHLRRLHTDGVSTALITFIRDGLAPNTLERLFLQDRKDYRPSTKVTIENIYKGALRRHRESLRKLSIDSTIKQEIGTSWKRWIPGRNVLAFITSGKMANLRELALSVEYEDWHFFLQNLPGLPRLRTLYVPNISDGHHPRPEARELALQFVDLITLRPEMELCYVGVLAKCFEIRELRSADISRTARVSGSATLGNSDWNNLPFEESDNSSDSEDDEDEDDDEEDEEDDDEDEDDDDDDSDDSDSTSSDSSSNSSDASEAVNPGYLLQLGEILFPAEKIELFKIRSGTIS